MKTLLPLLVPFLFASAVDGPEAVVRSQVKAFGEAFRSGDVRTIEGLLAARYSHCNSDGSRPSKEEWLAWFESRARALREGRFIYTEYRNEDVEVHVHGNAAVVSGVNVSAGRNDGRPFRIRLRFTNVWVLEGTRWRRAAFHDSRIEDEPRAAR